MNEDKISGSVVLFISFFLLLSCSNKNIDKDQLPNVILIIADDLGYADLSVVNSINDIKTPNIDRIANSGIRLTETYVNSPICNQSRAGIITGCYPQRLGSYWYSSKGLHDKKFVTIPELLKKKGYNTGYIGKAHYGDFDKDTTNRSFPLNHGFDYFFGHTSARKHYLNHKEEFEASFQKVKNKHNRSGQSLEQGALWVNKKKVDYEGHLTELIGKESRLFIKKNKEANFFLQIAFNAAHNFTHQLPEDYLKKNNLDGRCDWSPEKETYFDWYVKGRYPNNDEGRAHYLGQVSLMDNEIGKLLDFLESNELRENTLILFISDNGGSTPIYANNKPLRGSKYLLYEGGVKVQLLASYPAKYPKNIVYDNIVSAMDILPLICKETETEIPSHIDGIDISPILIGKEENLEHEILFWDTGHEIAVRKGDWKLRKAFNDQHAKDEMVNLEIGDFLYNLKEDVSETQNLKSTNNTIYDELENEFLNWKYKIRNGNK